MQLTGAEIIVECLKEQGVDTVFGYPGGAILNVYDALYEYKDEITHVLTSHEQGASHAADGYGKLPIDEHGIIHVPQGPGVGAELDWDLIEKSCRSYRKLEYKG